MQEYSPTSVPGTKFTMVNVPVTIVPLTASGRSMDSSNTYLLSVMLMLPLGPIHPKKGDPSGFPIAVQCAVTGSPSIPRNRSSVLLVIVGESVKQS